MKKLIFGFVIFLVCVTVLVVMVNKMSNVNNSSLKIIVATDLHYISPKINDGGEAFQNLMAHSDGKISIYCEELVNAFLDDVKNQKPDYLVLTGDLSFNGALQSHIDLAQKLSDLQATGIKVLVTTGNHDIYCRNAASFVADTISRLDSATTSDFYKIYNSFGYSNALSVDSDSLSYIFQADDSTRFLFIDSNSQDEHCQISDETLLWIQNQLEDSNKKKQKVIAFGHQNLFQQTMLLQGYIINKTKELQSIFKKNHVSLFLSGHLHVQHWQTENGITEIATSSLSVSPCQYGILQLGSDGNILYNTKKVDVSNWAKAQNIQNDDLINFENFADSYIKKITLNQCSKQLMDSDFSKEQIDSMCDFASKVNKMYFSGDMKNFSSLDPNKEIQNLWKKSNTFTGAYLSSMDNDIGKDYRFWSGKY